MDKENLNRMIDVIKVMESNSIWPGNIGLIFERQSLEGIVYRNELGYCSFGNTDGNAIFVNVKEFEAINSYIDILRSKKQVKEDHIEFRIDDKTTSIGRVGSEEIAMQPWATGKKIDINPSEIFNGGSDLNYKLLGNKFCFSSAEFFGIVDLSKDSGLRVKLSTSFVKVFEFGWVGVRLVDQGVIFTKDDLEVLLLSGVEGTEEALEAKYEREVKKIKDKSSFVIDNRENFKTLLEAAIEMRKIGADLINIYIEDGKVTLRSSLGVTLRRQLDIGYTGKFSGSLLGSYLDTMWKLKDRLTGMCVDDVMVLFEGTGVNMICYLADRPKGSS